MARPLRIEFPGGVYHITSRGDRREAIFLTEADRVFFLELLCQAIERFHWVCYAHCLMSNHYHLLIETPQPNLSRGMRHLNGVYTQRFNRRHERVGHVFQGRYKAIIVQKDSHLLALSRYVVLNPVRAQLVKQAREWPWSSYRATALHDKGPVWLTVEWILAQFAPTPQRAVQAYRRFVAEGIGEEVWPDLTGQIYYGDDEFITGLAKEAKGAEVPREQRQPLRPLLRDCVKSGTPEEIGQAYREYGYRLREIAQHLGVHYATVSRRLKRAETQR